MKPPKPPEDPEVPEDPLDYLTRHAARAVETAAIFENVARAIETKQLTVSDALVLADLIDQRGEAGKLLFLALCRDGRLPEGVRVLLGELVTAHHAIAALLRIIRPLGPSVH